jgi:hypothetical protein
MSFAKLDSGIVDSSLWAAPDHVVRVWIAILAKKDHLGIVKMAPSALRRLSNIFDDSNGIKFQEAINVLESPDPESRTPDFEGRRIEKIEGGWKVLNHKLYRKYSYSDDPAAIRQREYRKKKTVTDCDVSLLSQNTHNTSVSVSVSVSEEEEREKEIEVFDTFQLIYPGQKQSTKTEIEFFKKSHHNYKEYLPLITPAVKNQIKWRREMSAAAMFVPAWKSLKNWLAQKSWEEERPDIKNPNKPEEQYHRPVENEAIKAIREAEKDKPTEEDIENLRVAGRVLR